MPPPPLPNYMGYAEVRHGAELTPRVYLLKPDLDLSGDGLALPDVGTGIKVDPTAAQPELVIQLLAAIGFPDLRTQSMTIRLDRLVNRPVDDVEIRVFVMASTIGNFPVPAAAELVRPLAWLHAAYRCAAGKQMPKNVVFRLHQRVDASTGPTNNVIDAGIEVVPPATTTQPPLYPVDVSIGQFRGPASTRPAILTTFPNGVYTETIPAGPALVLDEATATSRMSGDLRITEPGAQAIDLGGRVIVRIDSPRAGPAPVWATPVAAVTGLGAVDGGKHRYKVAFVHANGNESGSTLPSAAVDVLAGGATVRLSGIPKAADVDAQEGTKWDEDVLGTPDAGLQITKRRIYRTFASEDGNAGQYFLVGEIDDATNPNKTTFDDSVADAALGAAQPSRMAFYYQAPQEFDIAGTVRLTDPAGDDTFDVALTGAPPHLAIRYETPASGINTVELDADAPLPAATAEATMIREGVADHFRIRAESVPAKATVNWRTRGSRTLVEAATGTDQPIGLAALLESRAALPVNRPAAAPQAVCLELVDRRPEAQKPSRMRVSARDVVRAKVTIGEPGPTYATLDNGITADVEFGAGTPVARGRVAPRSMRLLWIDETKSPDSRLWLRVGELPERITADILMPENPDALFGGGIDGGARLVKGVFVVGSGNPETLSRTANHRVRFALPRIGRDVDVERTGQERVVATMSEDIVAEASLRSRRPLAEIDLLRHVQAAVAIPPTVSVDLKRSEVVTDAPGASVRAALSESVDQVFATRANPQVRVRMPLPLGGRPEAVTARLLRVESVTLPAGAGKSFDVDLAFSAGRANESVRGWAEVPDHRELPGHFRQMAEFRTEKLPDKVRAIIESAESPKTTVKLLMANAAGPGEFFLEPTNQRGHGPFVGSIAGIGTVSGLFDRIPSGLHIFLDDPDAHPEFYDLPDGWMGSVIGIGAGESFEIQSLRAVSWSRDALDANDAFDKAFWAKAKALFIRYVRPTPLAPEDVDASTGLILWNLAERHPDNPTQPKSGLAWRVFGGGELTVDVDALEATTTDLVTTWADIEAFDTKAEFQLRDYAGGHVVAAHPPPAHHAPGPGAESGEWWVHALNAIPLGYDAFFGNTGGGPHPWDDKPRIWA